ncbi:MAG: quinolinate synthase NadA [Candidatus Thalassarchaeaceae archaeon]|jgi:quinolinate synthase|nr:quinolinate synthase NadA [Candidatus Thalassarchaeaceae archaeon]
MQLPSLPFCSISDADSDADSEQLRQRIIAAKKQLGNKVMILGHHYQRDSIIEHADETGDSFLLARKAADSEAEYIVFCGVHFMAESADILTDNKQIVVMPNIRAGCSMADMADLPDVEACWNELLANSNLSDPATREDAELPAESGASYLVPVTYMNSSADLKAFVGYHGGIVCTSSNAAGVLEWALERAGENGKVLFFPDQHLGRNTALAMGYNDHDLAVWNPMMEADWDSLNAAKFVLWHGYCSVHQRFTVEQINNLREAHPNALVIAHPECDRTVVDAADASGSTEMIRRYVEAAPSGSVIGVGTEIHLVKRLDAQYPDKQVVCLDPGVCPCSTMYMIHPAFLAELLERLAEGEVVNQIVVPSQMADDAILALNRMLSIVA